MGKRAASTPPPVPKAAKTQPRRPKPKAQPPLPKPIIPPPTPKAKGKSKAKPQPKPQPSPKAPPPMTPADVADGNPGRKRRRTSKSDDVSAFDMSPPHGQQKVTQYLFNKPNPLPLVPKPDQDLGLFADIVFEIDIYLCLILV